MDLEFKNTKIIVVSTLASCICYVKISLDTS